MVSQRGFTYLGVLYVVAITGIALAGTGVVWSLEARRDGEKGLLFAGEAYRQAIVRYALATPGYAEGAPAAFPERLADLLEDKRAFPVAHHLRRLYPDPLTGSADWQLIRREGRIVGVASRDRRTPIKTAGFARGQEDFAGATSYGQWAFIAEVPATASATTK